MNCYFLLLCAQLCHMYCVDAVTSVTVVLETQRGALIVIHSPENHQLGV